MNYMAEVVVSNHDLFAGPAILTRINGPEIETTHAIPEESEDLGRFRNKTRFVCREINECLAEEQSEYYNGHLALVAYADQTYLDKLSKFGDTLEDYNEKDVLALLEKAQNHIKQWLSTSDLDELVTMFEIYELPLPEIVEDRFDDTQQEMQEQADMINQATEMPELPEEIRARIVEDRFDDTQQEMQEQADMMNQATDMPELPEEVRTSPMPRTLSPTSPQCHAAHEDHVLEPLHGTPMEPVEATPPHRAKTGEMPPNRTPEARKEKAIKHPRESLTSSVRPQKNSETMKSLYLWQ
jgi:hypothetical protein